MRNFRKLPIILRYSLTPWALDHFHESHNALIQEMQCRPLAIVRQRGVCKRHGGNAGGDPHK